MHAKMSASLSYSADGKTKLRQQTKKNGKNSNDKQAADTWHGISIDSTWW